MKDEIWKDIVDYENLYQISNYGNVKSLNYRRIGKEHLLKQTTNNDGYKLIMLYKNGRGKMFSIHRLVAQTFIPNVLNKKEINHIDRDKTNNCANNLEWCTHKENTDYRDLTNKPTGNSRLTREEAETIKREKESGKNYKKVWGIYSNKISLSGFEKIWYSINWN